MIHDVWTILVKESKELTSGDARWVTASTALVFLAIIGVIVPWQLGGAWVEAPWVVAIWIWIPFFLVTTLAADAVAGERERRTLETLLATRLPDGAIVLGKLIAAAVWVWAATLLCVPLGLLTVNLTASGSPHALAPAQWLATAGVVLAAALFGASVGILVSMRADSVRQAQQTLALGSLLLFLLPIVAFRLLPDHWLTEVLIALTSGSPTRVAWWLTALLGAATLPAVSLALLGFRRRRLRLP